VSQSPTTTTTTTLSFCVVNFNVFFLPQFHCCCRVSVFLEYISKNRQKSYQLIIYVPLTINIDVFHLRAWLLLLLLLIIYIYMCIYARVCVYCIFVKLKFSRRSGRGVGSGTAVESYKYIYIYTCVGYPALALPTRVYK